ncbi:MAG TPA: 3-isopropylmalate dehydratase small subunit [Terriglobales bacterium]|jgi:3-isopropylmalate/(R)-2-methylmalate dehydratase small subunit|nr:3-isopropylmalate dehydratase small subunit [Terriglobales bacterium]
MQPFRILTGIAAPLDRANVDTDQIIPAKFLKRIERTGFGQFLFFAWRFNAEGKPNPGFILNEPRFQGAKILIAGRNFGCGSSREHAPWALTDYGFRAVIAPSFADIFFNNSFKNGLLPVILPDEQVAELMRRSQASAGYELTVNLETCEVSDNSGFRAKFEVDPFRRNCLLNGLDDIGLTLKQEPAIVAFEARRAQRPW